MSELEQILIEDFTREVFQIEASSSEEMREKIKELAKEKWAGDKLIEEYSEKLVGMIKN